MEGSALDEVKSIYWFMTNVLCVCVWNRECLGRKFCVFPLLSQYYHAHSTSETRCVGLPHITQCCNTTRCSHTSSVSSDTTYLESVSDLVGQDFNPTRLPPSKTPVLNSQIVTCIFNQSALNWGSHDHLLGYNNLLEWLSTQGNTYIYWFII